MCIHSKMKDHTFFLQPVCQFDQRLAWVKVSFLREEQSLSEAACKIGFQSIDACLINNIESIRSTGKAAQFCGIPQMRKHECSLAFDARYLAFPPANGLLSETNDRLFSAFAFAPWCKHAASKPRATITADFRTACNDGNCMALIGKFGGSGKARHACADDRNPHHTCSLISVFQRA